MTRVESGDVIYIPPVGPQVAVLGSVNQPAIYELRASTTVGEQIETAGGLNATADASRATLETIEDRTRKVGSLVLDERGKHHVLRDGDILRILPYLRALKMPSPCGGMLPIPAATHGGQA